MSQTDFQRFLVDLQTNSALREEVVVLSASVLVLRAKVKGYDLSLEEAQFVLESLQALSDEELDKVAGGEDAWGDGSGNPPPPGTTP